MEVVEVGDVKLLSIDKVAENLGISVKTLRKKIKDAGLLGRRIGNKSYVIKEEIENYLSKEVLYGRE